MSLRERLVRTHERLSTALRRAPHGVAAVPCALVLAWLWHTTTQPFVRADPDAAAVPNPVDPARLEADVRTLTERFSPRDVSSREGLDGAASFIASTFVGTGARVEEQTFEVDRAGHRDVQGVTFRNVVASFGPSNDDAERIVVGAHYDTCGPLPGADDNASGVAGLLELARQLGATRALPTRVDLVAYTLEEPPFFSTTEMGSAHHARALARKGVRVRGMLALEMIGYFSDAPDSQRYPTIAVRPFYPSRGDFIALVGRDDDAPLARTVKSAMLGTGAIPTYSMTGPFTVPGLDWSDHRNYWRAGYTALMVTDTAFLRNSAYHTDRDRPETLDYRRMGAVVRGVYAAVFALGR